MVKESNKRTYLIILIFILLITVLLVLFFKGNNKECYEYFDTSSRGLVADKNKTVYFTVKVIPENVKKDSQISLFENNTFVKKMNDDGKDGDKIEGDHLYTCSIDINLQEGEENSYFVKIGNKKTYTINIRAFAKMTQESLDISNKMFYEICSKADDYIDLDTGYVNRANVQKAIDAVYNAAKEKIKTGDVILLSKNSNSVVIRFSNGTLHLYQPHVKGVNAGGKNTELSIITMQPFYASGGDLMRHYTDFVETSEYVSECLDNVYYAEKYFDTEVTLDVLKKMGPNQIIVLATHGAFDTDYGLGPLLLTGESYADRNFSDEDEYSFRVLQSEDGRVFISPEFVKEYIKNLDNSFVYMGACYSYTNQQLVQAFVDAGADLVTGYTDEVYSDYEKNMFVSLMKYMATYDEIQDDYYTIEQASNLAKRENGYDDWDFYQGEDRKTSAAAFLYKGDSEYRLFTKHPRAEANIKKYRVKKPLGTDMIFYGNILSHIKTGHGINVRFVDQGSDEANEEMRKKVFNYCNTYVSDGDTIFTKEQINRIQPASALQVRILQKVNDTFFKLFDLREEQDGINWWYFLYTYYSYEQDTQSSKETSQSDMGILSDMLGFFKNL